MGHRRKGGMPLTQSERSAEEQVSSGPRGLAALSPKPVPSHPPSPAPVPTSSPTDT